MVKQGWQQPIVLTTGEIVECHIGLAMDTINIFASREQQNYSVKSAIEESNECPCNCNMSLGFIRSAIMSGTPDTLYETVGLEQAPFPICSVEICQSSVSYVGFENIIGSDFTPWEEGQQVIVMAYKAFLFSCCRPDIQLMPEFRFFNASGCSGYPSPAFVPTPEVPNPAEAMDQWEWRTSYRILQLCALPLMAWEKK